MQEKRIFTTFDSISSIMLVAVVLTIISTTISKSSSNQKNRVAMARAKQLAAQILIGGFKRPLVEDTLSKAATLRSIASAEKLDINPTGRIGMDPWGVPYYYRIETNSPENFSVLVLSSGPNRVLNTKEEYFSSSTIGDISSVEFQGDDLGSIQNSNTVLSQTNE